MYKESKRWLVILTIFLNVGWVFGSMGWAFYFFKHLVPRRNPQKGRSAIIHLSSGFAGTLRLNWG